MRDKRKLKGRKTRTAIYQAVEDIIKQGNEVHFTTREIAKQAGISQSCLYHHFAGLEEILISVFVEKGRELMHSRHLQQFETLQAYLQFLIRESIDSFQTMHNLCFAIREKVSLKAQQNERLRQDLYEIGQEMIKTFKNNIRIFFDDSISEDKLDLFTFGFHMFSEGIIGHVQMFRDQSPFGDTSKNIEQFTRLLETYLVKNY